MITPVYIARMNLHTFFLLYQFLFRLHLCALLTWYIVLLLPQVGVQSYRDAKLIRCQVGIVESANTNPRNP